MLCVLYGSHIIYVEITNAANVTSLLLNSDLTHILNMICYLPPISDDEEDYSLFSNPQANMQSRWNYILFVLSVLSIYHWLWVTVMITGGLYQM